MPKKTDSQHENRGKSSMENGGQKEGREQRGGGHQNDSKEHGGQKEGREQRGGGHQNDFQRQGRENESANLGDFQQQNREEGPGDVGGLGRYRKALQGNRKTFQGKGLGEGNKKNGCLPKLFMLALPFMAIGTTLLLGS